MNIIFVLLFVSMLLASAGLVGCIWAIRSGQYQDVASPAEQLVLEDKLKSLVFDQDMTSGPNIERKGSEDELSRGSRYV